MQSKSKRRLASVLTLASVALVQPSAIRADESGGSYWCTSDCDYSIALHHCGQGTQCTLQTCTGASGLHYRFTLYCAAAQ